MDLADLLNRDEPRSLPVTRIDGMRINPPGCGGVPLNLHVLLQGLRTYRATLLQERLNLTQNERVAFEGSRVMCFQMPDARCQMSDQTYSDSFGDGSPPRRSLRSAI